MNYGFRYPTIQAVDFRVTENGRRHRTSQFSVHDDILGIFRRGQKFKWTIRFDGFFDQEMFALKIRFTTGRYPSWYNGTKIEVQVRDHNEQCCKESWMAVWSSGNSQFLSNDELSIDITTASDAIVADWNVNFEVYHRNEVYGPFDSFWMSKIFILFNPWNRDDDVFMEDEAELDEYVLNDWGKIWQGEENNIGSTFWNYGQFERGILEASMKMLEISPRLARAQRGNPVLVSREIAAMVNFNDEDNGVLVGNWDGPFEGGRHPSDWTGSVEILKEWVSTGFSEVKYGQCWVFGGVVTTVMRSLGIPCRTVTNFESAHDADLSLTINRCQNISRNEIKVIDPRFEDSIWNFHVWNEVWMDRQDLPSGYGGWQVIDSTPHSLKMQDVEQIGPASVVAVRNGDVRLNYDTAYVFAEVNGDKYDWLWSDNYQPFQLLRIDKHCIGRYISTRNPRVNDTVEGNKDREDITFTYKIRKELTPSTYSTRDEAVTRVGTAFNEHNNEGEISAEIMLEKNPKIGEDFKLTIKFVNAGSNIEWVKSNFKVESRTYTGAVKDVVKKEEIKFNLKPQEVKDHEIIIRSGEYVGKLSDQASFVASVMSIVEETDKVHLVERQFAMEIPEIELQVPSKLSYDKPNRVGVIFQNPLTIELTDVKITVYGPGIEENAVHHLRVIHPRETVEMDLTITPKKYKNLMILAMISSNELNNVKGSKSVIVQ